MFNKDVYLENEDHYIEVVGRRFAPYFMSVDEFSKFVRRIDAEKRKEFLHLAAMYYYLVHASELKTEGHVVDYFDLSYKYIVLISLIEAASLEKHRDFYMWLNKKENKCHFSISRSALPKLYEKYKLENGALNKFLSFFSSLDDGLKDELRGAVKIDGNYYPLTNFAKFLYEIRSKFVHSAIPLLQISERPVVGRENGKVAVCRLPFGLLCRVFEHGLLIKFGFSPEDFN